jgi:hypothetical protein
MVSAGSLIYFRAKKLKFYRLEVFEAGTVDEIETRTQKIETQRQILHAVGASSLQSRKFFSKQAARTVF